MASVNRWLGLMLGALGALGASALGAVAAHADGDVLHEFIPNIDPDEPVAALAAHEADPSAIVYDGEVLQAPERSDRSSSAPAMVSTPGDGAGAEQPGQRSPSFRPDRITDLEGSLQYYEAFKPAIAPFKRVSALDATRLGADGVTPVLAVHDPRRRPVKVERADSTPPDARARDRFFGEVTLDFSQALVVPLPSVSPESRILSLRTEPPTELAIERDGADNFFAVAKKTPAGPVFAAFLTDAPRSYFGTALPQTPVAALTNEVPPLDAAIRARALGFAAELGLRPSSSSAAALSALTAHFRAFEESAEPPPDKGDIYLDLARSKKGICRHRAYAFVVTAHALGIPARFVQNEAHSWVEVKLARIGWMRIDLGGAAHGLTAHGADDRPMYQPAEPDPLPRPTAYERSYSLAGRDVRGVRKPGDKELQGRWVSPDAQAPAAQAQGRASFMGGPSRRAATDTSGRAPLTIVLAERQKTVLRGNELDVSGQVHDASGEGVGGLRIEISLAAQGRRERMLLGVAVSAQQGVFAGRFGIPPDLAAGDYQLVVVTPGNATYLPAIAE
jgi:transglutaminase-like putative cysteine protease